MKKVSSLHKKWIKDETCVEEYKALEPGFALASAIIAARSRAGLNQNQLAQRMKTTQSTIARLESGKSIPSGRTLQRIAEATESKLGVEFKNTHRGRAETPSQNNTSSAQKSKIAEISFSTRELLKLPLEERNFILAASFIVNDIRFHWSLMVRSPLDARDEYLKKMQIVRQLWSTRKLASVIFEADSTIGKFIGKIPLLKELNENSPPISKSNRKTRFMELARTIRNMAAYHYDSNDLSQNLIGFAKNAKHFHYAHNQHGNSICTIGEQVFTLQLIKGDQSIETVNEFDRWIRECSNSLLHFCNNALGKIITTRFPKKTYKVVPIAANEKEPPTHRWPLFLDV